MKYSLLTLILAISIANNVAEAREHKQYSTPIQHLKYVTKTVIIKHSTNIVASKHISHTRHKSNTSLVGVASWYGYESVRKGKGLPRTANGEVFSPYKMTAAHRTLPFGTKVKVTNLKNNESVVVVINDRGPFVHNRIIDLSKSAARSIGVLGLQNVALTIVSKPTIKDS